MTAFFIPYQGVTFHAPNKSNSDKHLTIVLAHCSESNHIAVANVSSIRGTRLDDHSCLLDVGDHRSIDHLSFVIYRYAILLEVDHVRSGIKNNHYKLSDTLAAPIESRIIDGALISRFTPKGVKDFVRANAVRNT